MEALIGASVAATTIYDMCKAVDRGMVVGDLRLLEKTGGKEDYVRPEEPVSAAGQAARVAPQSASVPQPMPAVPSAGSVVAVNVSANKGERKKASPDVTLLRASTASKATPTPVPGTAR